MEVALVHCARKPGQLGVRITLASHKCVNLTSDAWPSQTDSSTRVGLGAGATFCVVGPVLSPSDPLEREPCSGQLACPTGSAKGGLWPREALPRKFLVSAQQHCEHMGVSVGVGVTRVSEGFPSSATITGVFEAPPALWLLSGAVGLPAPTAPPHITHSRWIFLALRSGCMSIPCSNMLSAWKRW